MGEGATPLSQLMKVPFQIPWPHTRWVTFGAVGGGKSRLQIIIEIFNSICSDCTRIMGVRVPRDSVGVSPVDLFVPHENPAIEDTLSLVHHLPAVFLLGFQGTLRTHNISIYARYTNPCYADALCRQGADILYIDKFPRFPCSRSHFHPPTYLPTALTPSLPRIWLLGFPAPHSPRPLAVRMPFFAAVCRRGAHHVVQPNPDGSLALNLGGCRDSPRILSPRKVPP